MIRMFLVVAALAFMGGCYITESSTPNPTQVQTLGDNKPQPIGCQGMRAAHDPNACTGYSDHPIHQ